ncbi:MAG TPA: bifunctional tRNA (5-methylaminomethyl-2-thiouridine)(34)-methyltransferase MnmD/FAD-dependent 5-carboxymethylaminomethyl-2-thiouridine(34) oxidoreductase MnmC [Noviherbaspirillum sp.]|nr:bifunctional tRNA (5-methylaminomethyl-2-thiouridine)(34)-methyltransferase MnmD/FAD-dependent 5-carboxymethylaminomethyl-2-thiouridine(34) oxidoreductase MnmC [Noviherbaspirillum sp.]
MSNQPLVPAVLSFVNGVPYAEAFGDVYHSADGGLAQAQHVFLGGNRLPERWQGQRRFVILETGFGIGLNFLATWKACRDDAQRPQQLHYVSIEKHPFCAADLVQLHALWPELAAVSEELRAAWPPLVQGFHRLLLDEGRVVLTLVFGDVAEYLPQIDAAADAFYLDGFAPNKNPEMWAPDILARLNRLAAPEATLSTYTVAVPVRDALTKAGFICDMPSGFGHKREMLVARYEPRYAPRPQTLTPGQPLERRAIVIGAGLAGSAICERLAARGWQITLIERHDKPAQETSGNLAGIALPLLSKDDNQTSQLVRAAYLFTLQLWRRLGGIGHAFAGEACGVLQLAADAEEAQQQREMVESYGYPADYVRWLDAAAASELLGHPALHGGWHFPLGGWATPAALCDAMLAACGERLQRLFTQEVAGLERFSDGWRVRDSSGNTIAQAPVVIVATGTNATFFPHIQELPLKSIRGQVTHVSADCLPVLPMVVCGDGYVTRPTQGVCCVGASYEMDSDPQLRQSSHEKNLKRLEQVLPDASAGLEVENLSGRVGFRCVSQDRLPLVGALPDPAAPIAGSRLRDVPRLPGVYSLLAYGSRGLVWSPFAAELLASMLEGDPLPVPRDLAAVLDPARFVLKAHRQGAAA